MPARLSSLALALTIALLLVFPAKAQNLPSIVAAFPAEVDTAIIVPNLAELSDQLANFESASGLGVGELQDALGMFQRELGLINGLNRDGAMMVLLGGAAAGDGSQAGPPTGLMLLPVSDYAAMVGALGGDPAQPVSAITLPGGAEGFCKQLDDYAVLGGSEAAVTAIQAGDGPGTLTALVGTAGVTTITESQLSIIINTEAFEPDRLADRMSQISAAVMQQADAMLAIDLDPEPWMSMLQALSKKAATGTTAMVLGMSFSDDGLTYTESAVLKEGSELAAAYTDTARPANTSAMLASLPDRPMLFAAAGDPKAVMLGMLIDSLGGVIGLDPEHALGEVREPMDAMLGNATGCAFSLYAVPGGGKVMTHWFNSLTVLETADPVAQRAAVKQFITGLNGAALPMETGESIQLIALYRENDREIEGVSVDTFTLRMTVPQSAQTGPLTQAIALLAGGGFTGHVVAGPQHVIVTTVDDNNMTAEALRSLGRGTGIGNAGAIADLRHEHLPANPIAQAYLSFGGVADSINPFLQLMGNTQAISVPNNLPPVGVALTREGTGVRSVMFVPAQTVKLLVTESFDLSGEDEPGNQGF